MAIALPIVKDWLETCRRRKQIARNTIAMGIVVLDHLHTEAPTTREKVLSPGAEVNNSRGEKFAAVLTKYVIPVTFLKEATTRQSPQDGQRLFDAFEYGNIYSDHSVADRQADVESAISFLRDMALEWLAREHIKVAFDRQVSPAGWMRLILDEAAGRSYGKVEQHLVGAKLERRHPDILVENHPGHAGDVQTGRAGDFTIGTTCYHVTASPGLAVVGKCKHNLGEGLHPVLLVPRKNWSRAVHFAEEVGIADRITVAAIEDFIGLNVIEMAAGDQSKFAEVMKSILGAYNKRLAEVETDLSLMIEAK